MPRVTKTFSSKGRPATGWTEDNSQPSDEGTIPVENLVGSPSPVIASDPANAGERGNLPERSLDYSRDDNYNRNSGYRGSYDRPQRDYQDRDVPTEQVSGILDIMQEGHG